MEEHFFNCPYCGEEISILLDASEREQIYIEDCEVCCNPMEITTVFERGVSTSFTVKNIEQ